MIYTNENYLNNIIFFFNIFIKSNIFKNFEKQDSKMNDIKEFYENRKKKCLQRAMKNAVDCNVVNLRLDNLNNENPKNGKNKENRYMKIENKIQF